MLTFPPENCNPNSPFAENFTMDSDLENSKISCSYLKMPKYQLLKGENIDLIEDNSMLITWTIQVKHPEKFSSESKAPINRFYCIFSHKIPKVFYYHSFGANLLHLKPEIMQSNPS